jgi:hypothetical protein
MVNTFIVDISHIHLKHSHDVYTYNPFLCSALLLDNKRLPNQRREAKQILNLLYALRLIAHEMNIDLNRKSITQMKQMISTLKNYYLAQDYIIIGDALTGNLIAKLPKHSTDIKHDTSCFVVNKLGYVHLPVVLSWLGYEEALKVYLNAHIQATEMRGIKNNMPYYPIDVSDHRIHNMFKVALIYKEINRQESIHYRCMVDFVCCLLASPVSDVNTHSDRRFAYYVFPIDDMMIEHDEKILSMFDM